MRVLIACEFSGAVRKEFEALGHEAWSCDLLPTEIPGNHYQGDVRDMLSEHWDLMVAHPPCTHLAVSGARWFKEKQTEQAEALKFVRLLMNAPIERIAIENPISIISSRIRKPDQIIQPWQFGHGETKATCLWLKGLPKLQPTNIVEGREQRVHKMPPSPDRWRERSRTFAGIAQAMAQQWGSLAFQHSLHTDAGKRAAQQAFSKPEVLSTQKGLSSPAPRRLRKPLAASFEKQRSFMSLSGWIGVDLDGTLAEYHGWNGGSIGAPVPAMLARVKEWLAKEQQVKIFTSRVCTNDAEQIALIKAWCVQHVGQELEVTATKDFAMIELWDDRCVQVIPNKGVPVQERG